jgi:hypothetical protein
MEREIKQVIVFHPLLSYNLPQCLMHYYLRKEEEEEEKKTTTKK